MEGFDLTLKVYYGKKSRVFSQKSDKKKALIYQKNSTKLSSKDQFVHLMLSRVIKAIYLLRISVSVRKALCV